jgi:hypothetical protein
MAQSAFEGFYGQVSTGYESNSIGSGSGSVSSSLSGEYYSTNSSSQQINSAPLIFGLGYNFAIAPQWLVGIGADYSALSQTSSAFATSFTSSGITGIFSGNTIQLSNRINIFVTPSYVLAKDKLVYLKAGYSSVSAKLNGPTNYGVSAFSVNAPVSMSSSTSTVGGYIIGLGYKQTIAGGFYGFAEANYMSYSKPSFSSTGTINYDSGPFPIASSLSTSLNTYQGLIGVGYKF